MADIVIKKSKISGKGVFAAKDFKKGEVVLHWHPKVLKKSELEKLSNKEQHYIEYSGKKIFLMQAPERFVNHSCDPNTKPKNNCDLAIRDIKKGEEITSKYSSKGLLSFRCNCKSKKCKKIIY